MNFDTSGKDLRWIYCHLFQSYAPPDQDWVFNETVHYRNKNTRFIEYPLRYMSVMATEKDVPIDGVHWLRDLP